MDEVWCVACEMPATVNRRAADGTTFGFCDTHERVFGIVAPIIAASVVIAENDPSAQHEPVEVGAY